MRLVVSPKVAKASMTTAAIDSIIRNDIDQKTPFVNLIGASIHFLPSSHA
jgi:hypothetical protein